MATITPLWRRAVEMYANREPRMMRHNGRWHAVDRVTRMSIASGATRAECVTAWREQMAADYACSAQATADLATGDLCSPNG